MGNVLIGWRNRFTPGASLSGGAWSAPLPLANLLSDERALVARSNDAALVSTKMDIDFGLARALRVFALLNHNLSQAATWRVNLGSTAGGSDVYAGAWQAAWFIPFGTGSAEWESGSWWAMPNDEYIRHPFMAPILLPATQIARYLHLEINDPANPDGYVQLGRVFAGETFRPTYNASYGIKNQWVDLSKIDSADSGAGFAERRRRQRRVAMELNFLNPDEAAVIHELQRRSGLTEEVLYVPDESDYQATQRYGFCGRLTELNAAVHGFYHNHAVPFAIEEWL